LASSVTTTSFFDLSSAAFLLFSAYDLDALAFPYAPVSPYNPCYLAF